MAALTVGGGAVGSAGTGDTIGDPGLLHFCPPSQLAVISMPITFTDVCGSTSSADFPDGCLAVPFDRLLWVGAPACSF